MSETKVPALPAVTDSNLTAFAKAAKQLLDVREGLIGDPLDANVTFRDLVDAGAVSVRPGWNGKTGSPVTPPWTEPDGYDPTSDFLSPPRPEGVQVTGMFALVMIQFNEPPYRNHAYAEIWRSNTNVLGNAIKIGTTDTRFYSDSVGASASFYYWVRFVSKSNVIGPYNATDGLLGETATDPALVIASLTGQITESQLYSSLAERISLIDAPATTPGSVNERLAVVQSQVNDLLSTPLFSAGTTYQKDALVNYNGAIYQAKQVTTGNLPTDTTYWTKIGDYSSLGEAVAAQATQISTLTTNLAAETSARTTLASAFNNPTTGLEATRSTLLNDYYTKTAADSAISSATTALSNTVNNTLAGYVTNSALTTNYYTKSATDSAISQATTDLSSSINNTLTGYATNATLSQSYYTKTQTDSAISAATSTLVSNTALTNALGAYTTTSTLTQQYYTKTQTDSAISSATSGLVSNTALTNALGSYVTNATLTTNYYTRTQTDSAISSATSTLLSTTALNDALGNYTTTAALQQNYYTRTQADAAISSATQTLVSTTALNNALGSYTTTAALQQNYYTRASAAGLEAQYTVKTDLNGYVSGFGLASTAVGAVPTSSFTIRADSFSIANPTGPSVAPAMPFIVRTTSTTIGGVNVPVGVYLTDAFIQNGTISNAKIANAAIDNAKIANLDASKITTGFLSADRIQTGTLDAKIANISAAVITSGTISSARIGDASIGSAKLAGTIQSDNYSSTSGWQINRSGSALFNEVSLRGSINGGAYTGYAWPSSGTGFHLGPNGLLLGNYSTGRYFQVDSGGDVYAPGFTIVNGQATFSGALANTITVTSGQVIGVLMKTLVVPNTFSGVAFDLSEGNFLSSNTPAYFLNGEANRFLIWSGSMPSPETAAHRIAGVFTLYAQNARGGQPGDIVLQVVSVDAWIGNYVSGEVIGISVSSSPYNQNVTVTGATTGTFSGNRMLAAFVSGFNSSEVVQHFSGLFWGVR